MSRIRVGQGFDVHAFGSGDHVMLGGVRIEHTHGLEAHSDGDVALHALCDALLGALAMGDIGVHFPPSDARWAGADSRELLRRVVQMVREQDWWVGNVDLTIICEQPRVRPHAEQMAKNIAADLAISSDRVGVKATTTERLGFTGRSEGIAAMAICLLERP